MISLGTVADLMSLTASEVDQPSSASASITPDRLADSDAEVASDTDTSDTELSDLLVNANPEALKRQANSASLDDYLKTCQVLDQKTLASKSTSSPQHEDKELPSARIIDKVRDYQQELFERAREENVIAVYVLSLFCVAILILTQLGYWKWQDSDRMSADTTCP